MNGNWNKAITVEHRARWKYTQSGEMKPMKCISFDILYLLFFIWSFFGYVVHSIVELNANIKVSCWVSIDNGRNGDICYSWLLSPADVFSITNNMANGHGLSPFDIPGPIKVSCAIVYNNEVFGIIIMIISCVLPPSYASTPHEYNLCFHWIFLIWKQHPTISNIDIDCQ